MKQKKSFAALLAILLCLLLFLSACGASSGGNYAVQDNDVKTAESGAVLDEDVSGAAAPVPADTAVSADPAVDAGKKIIRTAELRIRNEKVQETADEIAAAAKKAGGYVESSDLTDEYGVIRLRIPAAKGDGFLETIRGTYDVKSFSDSAEDVTLQYADTESRLNTKRAAYARYEKLLDQAKDVKEVMAIQSKMDEITADIESYEAQLKALDNDVNYTVVTVTISGSESSSSINIFEGLGDTFLYDLQGFLEMCVHVLFVIPFILLFVWLFFFLKDHRKRAAEKRAAKKAAALAKQAEDTAAQEASGGEDPAPRG